MTRLSEERGFALIPALLITMVMIALGFAIVARVEGSQEQSLRERTRESSFDLAEAALGAEATQLARTWPSASGAPNSCDPASTAAACPQSSAISNGYASVDYTATCASSSAPQWQTIVRDNASGEQYWASSVDSRGAYDGATSTADGVLWVRATATVRCNRVSVVALVSRSVVAMDFPANVVTANFFGTTNQGRKVLVDTLGAYAQPPSIRPSTTAAQPASIFVRCSGLTDAQCLSYSAAQGQVQPPAVRIDRTASSSALSLTQLAQLKQQASAASTYWASGTCPTTAAQVTSVGGAPVYVEGPCNISINSGTINSSASPGVLVIENGTLTLGGTAGFYGLLYCVNKQGSSAAVVSIQGNSTLQGVVGVDGLGGISAGSSKTNIIFDPRAPTLLRGSSGAAINKNSFRVLSAAY
jgi:Tfp pilus assembly protein PilX